MSPDAIRQSQAYAREHRLPESERLLAGFRDPGRGIGFDDAGLPVKPPRREMLVVQSPELDPVVAVALAETRAAVRGLPKRIDRIAWVTDRIAEWMPENDPKKNSALLAEIAGPAGRGGAEISVGQLIAAKTGVCRHRSLLFKLLADDVGVPAALVRGNYLRRGADKGDEKTPRRGAHAWNEAVLESGERIVVDAMHGFVGGLDHKLLASYTGVDGQPLYAGQAAGEVVDDAGLSPRDLSALREGRWVAARGRSGAQSAYVFLESLGPGEEARLRGALQRAGLRHDAYRTGLGGEGAEREVIRVRGAALFRLSRLGVRTDHKAPAPLSRDCVS